MFLIGVFFSFLGILDIYCGGTGAGEFAGVEGFCGCCLYGVGGCGGLTRKPGDVGRIMSPSCGTDSRQGKCSARCIYFLWFEGVFFHETLCGGVFL